MKIWSLSADGKFIQLLEIDSNCHYNPKAQARINYGFVYLNTCSDLANAAADQLPQLSLVAAAKSVGGGGASSSLSPPPPPPPSDRSASSSLFSSAPAHQHIYSTSLATVLIFGHLIVWHT